MTTPLSLTTGNRQTCNKTLNNASTMPITVLGQTMTTGDSQTCIQKLDHLMEPLSVTSGNRQTCNKKLKNTSTMPITVLGQTMTTGDSQTCIQKLDHLMTTPLSVTSGNRQTCNKKLKNTSTMPITVLGQTMTTGDSQTCNKKLITPSEKKKPTTKKNKHSLHSETGKKENRNKFSASLQVAKAAKKSNNPGQQSANLTKNKVKVMQGPPINAKKRSESESLEEFYIKHINFYIDHMPRNYSQLFQQLNTEPGPPMLTTYAQPLVLPSSPPAFGQQIQVIADVHQPDTAPTEQNHVSFLEHRKKQGINS
ncbi:hypothetical protein J6590_073548 [Homalodisca vitripennis]|nr:hypothetical protein J6590_073548 [Homalodisca vitripennis]